MKSWVPIIASLQFQTFPVGFSIAGSIGAGCTKATEEDHEEKATARIAAAKKGSMLTFLESELGGIFTFKEEQGAVLKNLLDGKDVKLYSQQALARF